MPDYTPNYKLKKPLEDDFYNIDDLNHNSDIIDTELDKIDTTVKSLDISKVDKTEGKGLSSNDFTDEYKNKIDDTETTAVAHIRDSTVHVTQNEKNRWDNIANINLIINSDFKVWQRGTEFQLNVNAYTYTADRWKAKGTGKVVKDDKGLKVTGGFARIVYTMEDVDYKSLMDKPISFSWSKNGVIGSRTYNPPYHKPEIFNITLEANEVLNWVRLSVGELPLPYIPTIYADEFNKCQRYYRETPFMQSGFSSPDGNTAISWGIVNTNMRIMPNVSVKSLLNPIDAGKIDLIKMFGSGSSILPNFVMSNVGISRVILLLPAGFNGMQGILMEDAEIY